MLLSKSVVHANMYMYIVGENLRFGKIEKFISKNPAEEDFLLKYFWIFPYSLKNLKKYMYPNPINFCYKISNSILELFPLF